MGYRQMNDSAMAESYFSFYIDEGIFSVPVKYVKEVFDYETITPIPNTLPYLKGVMNVRGSVVSIIDFRILFGFKKETSLEGTQVIILEVAQKNDKPVQIGIVSDRVDIVSHLKIIQAESKDYGILEGQSHFVSAVARRGQNFILILNPEIILQFIEADVDRDAAGKERMLQNKNGK